MTTARRAAPDMLSLMGAARAWILLLGRRSSAGVAFLLGAAGAYAHAPYHILPLLVVALTGLVWLLDGAASGPRPLRSAFWRGWAFGVGYFGFGLWWVGNAFIERGPAYAPFAPVGVAGLALGLALFWGAAAMGAMAFWGRPERIDAARSSRPLDARRIAVFAAAFAIAEFLRGNVLSGFPWAQPGLVWPAGGAVSQAAAWVGVSGLGALTLFAFAAPAALAGPAKPGSRRAAALALGGAVVIGAALLGGGRLASAIDKSVPDVALRVVQPQVSQDEKWLADNRDAIVARYLELTGRPGLKDRTHVIWPESALPMWMLEEPRVLDEIAYTLAEGQVLLTGLLRRDTSESLSEPDAFNSFGVITFERRTPVPTALYDKHKLVPFGEVLPASSFLDKLGLRTLTHLAPGWTQGAGRMTLRAPGAPPFAPQICYEIIFPGYTPRGAERPGWIVNVSNDAWYGASAGPAQGLNQARFRAIEEGLPVVRAVTGGRSAVIDPYGRLRASLPITAEAVIDAPLPAALPPTLYALVGEAGFVVILVLVIGAAASRSMLT